MFLKASPLLMILILFGVAFILPLIKNEKNIYKVSIVSLVSSLFLSILNLYYVLTNSSYKFNMGHFNAPYGIEINIGICESFLAFIFNLVTVLVVLYSFKTIKNDIKKHRIMFYYLLINITLASLFGMLFTNDLFNAFVFIEISNLASCGIIVIKDKKENIKATIKYLILSCLGSGLVLMGIAFIYSITGNLNMDFAHMELLKVKDIYSNVILISIGLFTIGFGVKGAMFPLHIWLPDAHSSAPAPSSALLSSLVIKGAVVLMIKVFYRVYGFEIINNLDALNMVLVLGCAGMIIGSIFAILQKEAKRVIAYSSVAQMGYIFFAIGLGGYKALAMAFYHIMSHALTKSALFLCVGTMIHKKGKKVEDLKGVGIEMPKILGLFTIAAFSMVGIPILPGFISKWNLSILSIESTRYNLIFIILLSSLLNLVYYFPIIINGYFGEENIDNKKWKSKEIKGIEFISPLMLIISMIFMGLYSGNIIKLLEIGAKAIIFS